jgi:hypothetical protein
LPDGEVINAFLSSKLNAQPGRAQRTLSFLLCGIGEQAAEWKTMKGKEAKL